MQLGRVFISSVFGGMLDLRDTAAQAARLVGLDPALMERLVAQPGSVRDILEREIAACDTYVGLFDRRRGTVPQGSDEDKPRAITEEEFALARERGLRCLVFLSRAATGDREPGLNEFLDAEVTEYRSGLWTRFYDGEAALRREIAAGLATLRPRVVLALSPGAAGLEARLFLRDLAPAWTKETVLGPVPVRLGLSPGARQVLAAFRRGEEPRSRLSEERLRFLGMELGAAALPGALGEALAEALDLAAHFGRFVTVEVRTADSEALALPWELVSLPRHPLPVQQGLVEIVRRLPDPGAPVDPARDTAALVPSSNLAVLGFTAAPAEYEEVQARPGTGGFEASGLFWEKEQERLLIAFESLFRERRGRLILPDTGEKDDLRQRLAQADRPQVVHISCHGESLHEDDGAAEPVLLLEDADGRRAPLRAHELLAWLGAAPGEAREVDLLVLSSCSTAGTVGETEAGDDEATGLSETLVSRGLHRVLGMQSTVSDEGATAFAEKLYARLADGADLPSALRAGRVELGARGKAHEWAVPTLTTRCDAGPLVAPKGSAPPVEHPFEAARGAFEIAGISHLQEGYVGRRDAERRLRRIFETERLIAVHGLGGIGKSTLATRFLERRQSEGWRALILCASCELAPATVFEAVAAWLGLARPDGVPAGTPDAGLRKAMKQALRAEPTALFLDNFEDNQDGDGHLKDPALAEALLDLLDLGGPRFRMLFTSRLPVGLGDGGPVEVRNLDLGELSPSGCRKLRVLDPAGLGQLSPQSWERVLFHFGGHPKALELLCGYLKGRQDRVHEILADLTPALSTVEAWLRHERQQRGRKLLVAALLDTIPEERRRSFDRLCLLEVPLPTDELIALLAADGIASPAADLGWLRDHGFLARTVAPSALTGGDAVHRLLASRRQNALAEREGAEVVRAWHLRVAQQLIQPGRPYSNYGIAARHRDAAGDGAGALELYNRWVIALRRRHAYAACLQIAEEGLGRFRLGESEPERAVNANLRLTMHDVLIRLGRIGEAQKTLDAALELVREGQSEAVRFSRASALLRKARELAQKGKTDQALTDLAAALADFEAGRHSKDRAVAMGEIARLRAQSGDVAEALKLYEEMLAIFEDLKQPRERAITLGDIARLKALAGDVPGALKLYDEMQEIFEELKDVRSHAVTQGEIARLWSQSGKVAKALKRHEERLQIFEDLGEVRELAVAQGDVARLQAQSGDVAGALKLHEERLQTFLQLGDVREHAVAQGDVARLRSEAGDLAGALKLHQERLQVFQELRDVRSQAVTQGDIARLQARTGDAEGALKLHEARLQVLEKLGDVREHALALGDIARLRAQSGDVEGALKLHEERLKVFEKLGDVREIAVTQADIARS